MGGQLGPEATVDPGGDEIERQHRELLQKPLDERLATGLHRAGRRPVDSVEELRRGDRRQGDLLVPMFREKLVPVECAAFRFDQYAGVDQRSHGEGPAGGWLRVMSSRSSQKPGSGFGRVCKRLRSSASVNDGGFAGTISQIGVPPRSTMTVSPRYWTRFKRSENVRAASVAEIRRAERAVKCRVARRLVAARMTRREEAGGFFRAILSNLIIRSA